jgi:hypothetical protein
MEDTHPTGADEQTDDDEHDPPEQLSPEDREYSCDHQDDREDPQKRDHDGTSPIWRAPGRRHAQWLVITGAAVETAFRRPAG